MNKLYFLLALIFFSCGSQHKKDKIKPVLSNITESVYASLTVRPEATYFPQSNRSGIIEEIYVEEGEIVRKGQILFQISTTADVSNRLTNAELNLKEAKANYLGEDNLLLNIESELQSLRQQLLLDSTNFKRNERLRAQNASKQIDFERAKLSYESTLSRYSILKNKYAQTLNSLENSYQKARNLVKAERTQLGDFAIRAKMDGKVYSIQKEVGELISPQEKFAEIGSAERFVIEMDIDEVDITKISLGDTVSLFLEAYPNEVYLAKTSKISPKKDEITQTFRVESQFIQPPTVLYNGLSGEANIIVATRKAVPIIPSEYLMPNNQVLTEDGPLDIKTGIKNMEFVEILAGIDTSFVLLKPAQP